jgi:hypothetical protein
MYAWCSQTGIYLLAIIDEEGNRKITKIVKE